MSRLKCEMYVGAAWVCLVRDEHTDSEIVSVELRGMWNALVKRYQVYGMRHLTNYI